MALTVTEAALIDLEKQKDAAAMRAKSFQQRPMGEPGDMVMPPAYVDHLTRPVRLEITFTDPIATRQQIEVLQAALVEALVLTQQHEIGINRQRMRLREVVKTAADTLTLLTGRTPAGRRRKAMQDLQNTQD